MNLFFQRRIPCLAWPSWVCLILVAAFGTSSVQSADDLDWIQGSGSNVKLRLTGTVTTDEGLPATGFSIRALLTTNHDSIDLAPKITGSTYSCWVPVGSKPLFFAGVHLEAISADGATIARASIASHQFRSFARNGWDLQLRTPDRIVEVAVTDGGKPVASADVELITETRHLAQAVTDAAGIAYFPLSAHENLNRLSARTDDFKIGGYVFDRPPYHNRRLERHSVELTQGHQQTFRFLNSNDGSPVNGLEFFLSLQTDQRNTVVGNQKRITDAKGESEFAWYPEMEGLLYFTTIEDSRWRFTERETADDGAYVMKLKPSPFVRKKVEGQIESADGNVAGFLIQARSFEGEYESAMDIADTVSDANGKFTIDVLPGSTYCLYVNDDEFDSNNISLIPYDPKTAKINSPTLTLTPGNLIEILFTSGPAHRPVPGQRINLRSPYDFEWIENGEEQSGELGRNWSVFTDENGKAYTTAPLGRLRARFHSPSWNGLGKLEVTDGGTRSLELHQRVASKRMLWGRLVLPDDLKLDLAGTKIEIGSIDGATHDRISTTAKADGTFSFESVAAELGIFAITADGKAAAVAVGMDLNQTIEIPLMATSSYSGQLVGFDRIPLADYPVQAIVRVAGKRDFTQPARMSFVAKEFVAKTDRDGNFNFRNIPSEVTLRLEAPSILDPADFVTWSSFYRLAGSVDQRIVTQWPPAARAIKRPLEHRFESGRRDCQLLHYHLMTIFYQSDADCEEFVDQHFLEPSTTEDNAAFIQLVVSIDENKLDPIDAQFAKDQNWKVPESGRVSAWAMDSEGKPLGQIELDIRDPKSAELAARFVHQHAPKKQDAKIKWANAFAEAKQTNRKVLVTVGHRYCGPCFRLARWMDSQRELLEQDFVLLKIDSVRDLNSLEVCKRLYDDRLLSFPFFGIFDTEENRLIDSEGPNGNIGFPSEIESQKHLRRMLNETREVLSAEDVDRIISSLVQ